MSSFKPVRILRLPEVSHKSGKSRSSIYADMKAGKFPQGRKIGTYARGWLESEIDDWIKSTPES